MNVGDTVSIEVGGTHTTILMPDDLDTGTEIIVEDARDQSETMTDGNLIVAGHVFDISYHWARR